MAKNNIEPHQRHKFTAEDSRKGAYATNKKIRERKEFREALLEKLAEASQEGGDKTKLQEVIDILVDHKIIKEKNLKAIELAAKISGALKDTGVKVESDTYTIKIE